MTLPRAAIDLRATGHPWAPLLPSHWGLANLKWLALIYAGGTPDKSNIAYWTDGTIPWLASGEVNQKRVARPTAYITDQAYRSSSAKWIPSGALVMALAGQGKTRATVAQLMFETTCNQSLAAIVPRAADARYLFWWLEANYANLRGMSGDDTRDGLNLEILGNVACPLPSALEQAEIVAFLDRETTRIDALVEKKTRLIELLREKRQAFITQATTRGLDRQVRRKDSGVVWLGEMPEHWSITRLKYAASLIVDCPHDTPVYSDSGEFVVLRTADIADGSVYLEDAYRLDEAEYMKRVKRAPLLPGDIVYGREGERWGHAAQVPLSPTCCLGQRMMQFRASLQFDPNFLMWQLNAESTYRQGQADTFGSTSPHVNVATIRDYILTEPPLSEQRAIAASIQSHCDEVDRLVASVFRSIDLLSERRAALITAAVTGKIDVRFAIEATDLIQPAEEPA